MNKSELIAKIQSKTVIDKKVMSNAIDALVESISEELANGGTVQLVGFGTFSVKERAARTGRNPQTGEEIQIAASKVPSFKAGKAFKDAVK
ncbi:HU family DNA-binding protein [Moraxella osloensis]|nr:HU family DNA-binding protein [Moraxella osloensis]QRO12811.1 HU family DNA-binding protein [Moraxella osloensis]